MMQYRVKRKCVLFYGSCNRISVSLNVGQLWELKSEPSEYCPYYTLTRANVLLEIIDEDFEQYFEPQESEDKI